MIVLTAPNYESLPDEHLSVFLGGGITGAPLWQQEVIDELAYINKLTLYNPRRENYKDGDEYSAKEQIRWEHHYLALSDVIMFWFPKEAKCMITLFELGFWLNSPKELIIACESGYEREIDVRTQVELARRRQPVLDTLPQVMQQIADKARVKNPLV